MCVFLLIDRIFDISTAVSQVRFTPGWFPGVQYKKIAKKVQERLHQAYDVPYSQIKEQMVYTLIVIIFI